MFPIISAKPRAETTALVQMHALKEEPYVPADDGFVFQTYIRENNLSCQEDLFHTPQATGPLQKNGAQRGQTALSTETHLGRLRWCGLGTEWSVPSALHFFSAASSVNSYVIPKCDSESER